MHVKITPSVAAAMPRLLSRTGMMMPGRSKSALSRYLGGWIVEPVPADRLTLSERLDRFDPLKHGGEVMADDRISAERLLTVYP